MLRARLNGEVGDVPADRTEALPPAKAPLALAIAAVNRAREELEAAQEPIDTLAHARAAATPREAPELRSGTAGLRAAHKREINLWAEPGRTGLNPPQPPR